MNSMEELNEMISLMLELADCVSVTASGYVVQSGSKGRVLEILDELSRLFENRKEYSGVRYLARRMESDLNKGPVVSFDLWHDTVRDILKMTDG